MKLTKKGFRLIFTQPLDPQTVSVDDIVFEKWGYNYSSDYGSPKIDLTEVPVKSAKLKKDNTVLEVKLDLETDKVFSVKFPNLKNEDGQLPSVTQAYYTLTQLK